MEAIRPRLLEASMGCHISEISEFKISNLCWSIPEDLEAVLGEGLWHVEGGELDVDGAVLLRHVEGVRVRVGVERGLPVPRGFVFFQISSLVWLTFRMFDNIWRNLSVQGDYGVQLQGFADFTSTVMG